MGRRIGRQNLAAAFLRREPGDVDAGAGLGATGAWPLRRRATGCAARAGDRCRWRAWNAGIAWRGPAWGLGWWRGLFGTHRTGERTLRCGTHLSAGARWYPRGSAPLAGPGTGKLARRPGTRTSTIACGRFWSPWSASCARWGTRSPGCGYTASGSPRRGWGGSWGGRSAPGCGSGSRGPRYGTRSRSGTAPTAEHPGPEALLSTNRRELGDKLLSGRLRRQLLGDSGRQSLSDSSGRRGDTQVRGRSVWAIYRVGD